MLLKYVFFYIYKKHFKKIMRTIHLDKPLISIGIAYFNYILTYWNNAEHQVTYLWVWEKENTKERALIK